MAIRIVSTSTRTHRRTYAAGAAGVFRPVSLYGQ